MKKDYDVGIIGGGMGGLCAALSVISEGGNVVIFESGKTVGGAARWAAGRVWTHSSFKSLRYNVPLGDNELQKALIDNFQSSLKWLVSFGLPFEEQPANVSGMGMIMGLGKYGDRTEFLETLANKINSLGGEILLGSRVTSIRKQESAKGFDIYCENLEDAIETRAIVIATGGAQGDRGILNQYLGPEANYLMLRTDHNIKGDGFHIGLELGGTHSRGMGSFYGHSMPIYSERLQPSEYKEATLSLAAKAILINQQGLRFVDESNGLFDENNPFAGMYQQNGIYFLICDGALEPRLPKKFFYRLAEKVEMPISSIFLEAQSITELVFLLEKEWGVPQKNTHETIQTWNNAFSSNSAEDLKPTRGIPETAISEAPFYAVKCIPAITLLSGGLLVDDEFQLLDNSKNKIPNVYVSGGDAGGVFVNAYAGGLAWALVSGRNAGLNAYKGLSARESL